MVGTFGQLATLSFYPAHHITTGEGGAVCTDSGRLAQLARSIRDWGRDCFCGYENPPEGKCGRRRVMRVRQRGLESAGALDLTWYAITRPLTWIARRAGQ